MNFTREINNRDAFQLQSDVLNMLWNNERASMAYNLLVLLTVPLIMTALIMILIEIKVNKLIIFSSDNIWAICNDYMIWPIS